MRSPLWFLGFELDDIIIARHQIGNIADGDIIAVNAQGIGNDCFRALEVNAFLGKDHHLSGISIDVSFFRATRLGGAVSNPVEEADNVWLFHGAISLG